MPQTLSDRLTVMDYLKACIRKLIYTLVVLFPRNKHKAVFGSYRNSFSDNSKYLYLHWQQQQFIRCIWISGNKEIIRQRINLGHEAYYRWSAKGIFHCLSAKYYFYNSYIGDINQWLANGAIKINLWHGLPMKKIEFDIHSGPMAQVFNPQGKWQQFKQWLISHQQLIKPDLMLSPSPLMDKIFSSAFKLETNKTNEAKLIRASNPRTDYYQHYPEQQTDLIQFLKSSANTQLDTVNTQDRQVIVYAPSWRDSKQVGNPYLQAFDWQVLSEHLQRHNQILLLRLHPNENALAADFEGLANIVNISNLEDVYGILQQIDLLITDYSSLFIDALPLGTAICFYRFDEQDYLQDCRDMYEFANKLPEFAAESTNFDELLKQIAPQMISKMKMRNGKNTDSIETTMKAYQTVTRLFWGQTTANAFTALEDWIDKKSV